jgi:hypothetical protein
MLLTNIAKRVIAHLSPNNRHPMSAKTTREPESGIREDLYLIYLKTAFREDFESKVELLKVHSGLSVRKRHRLMVYAWALSNDSNFVDMWEMHYAHESISNIPER